MRIALVNPPDENRIFTEVPSRVNEKSGVLPPLGLLYLEAYLGANTDYQVKIFDCPAVGLSHGNLAGDLKSFDPHVVGITGHTHNLADMLAVSKNFKELNPRGRVVWGGAHVSAFPDRCLVFPQVDYCIPGEGELTFAGLLKEIDGNSDGCIRIPGVVARDEKGNPQSFEPAPELSNLDQLPHPRRQVLDPDRYYYTIGSEVKASSFISSRGCPFHCTFCSTPGNRFRWRTAGDIADEMQECAELGIRELYFVDDTFNVRQDRVLEICDEIMNRGIKLAWNYRGRIDLITEEQLDRVRRAGCTRIQLGVETGTDEGLMCLKKGITTDQIRRVFQWLKKTDITSVAYFMIGCPHEKTPEDIMRTVDFAKEIDPDYVLFGVLTPYPGTEIYGQGIEKGIIDPKIWEEFVANPSSSFRPQPWTEFFTSSQLESLLDKAYKRFYSRPGYILKRLKEVRSFGELWRKVKAGVNILK